MKMKMFSRGLRGSVTGTTSGRGTTAEPLPFILADFLGGIVYVV